MFHSQFQTTLTLVTKWNPFPYVQYTSIILFQLPLLHSTVCIFLPQGKGNIKLYYWYPLLKTKPCPLLGTLMSRDLLKAHRGGVQIVGHSQQAVLFLQFFFMVRLPLSLPPPHQTRATDWLRGPGRPTPHYRLLERDTLHVVSLLT